MKNKKEILLTIISIVVICIAAVLVITLVIIPGSENKYYDGSAQQTKIIKTGDVITLGSYEQDNDTSNGKEAIEWIVLDIEDGKALLVSKCVLDAKAYNSKYEEVTWETCTLRDWLNSDFIKYAFADYEAEIIPTVTVPAEINPEYETSDPGNDTYDRVFLLSYKDAAKYFSEDERGCEATEYAAEKGSGGSTDWWLRSPGYSNKEAAYVNGESLGGYDADVDWDFMYVRPALYIDLGTLYN